MLLHGFLAALALSTAPIGVSPVRQVRAEVSACYAAGELHAAMAASAGLDPEGGFELGFSRCRAAQRSPAESSCQLIAELAWLTADAEQSQEGDLADGAYEDAIADCESP
jgi:hypothetical protein